MYEGGQRDGFKKLQSKVKKHISFCSCSLVLKFFNYFEQNFFSFPSPFKPKDFVFYKSSLAFLQTEPFRRLQAILKMAFTSLLTIQIIHTICRSNSNGSFCFPLVKDNWGCCQKLPYRDHHINA